MSLSHLLAQTPSGGPQMASRSLSPLPSPRVDPPVDSLQLPLPPTEVLFTLEAKASRQIVVRYSREGTMQNAKAAVVGKGGFGTVYRFERDDSFTPPETFESGLSLSSVTHSTSQTESATPDSPALTGLSPALSAASLSGDAVCPEQSFSPPSKGVKSQLLPQQEQQGHQTERPSGEQVTREARAELLQARTLQIRRSAAPAVVILKVCRTPVSGAFDEMPKTGRGRALARAADQAAACGDTSGFHTRVVRGEARLFRFLQIVAKQQRHSGSRVGLVRMLADLPFGGDMRVNEHEDSLAAYEAETGPLPRMLAFERCVELDASLTPRGWQKRTREWTHQEVEDVARDVATGLAFLHSNHIVHGDLKPSNIMRDAHTGCAKIIDLGASRRFICVPNLYKDSLTAVEAFDRFLAEGSVTPQALHIVLTEGLGSLTGTPHYMAPEVLLQAGRYTDHRNISRSVLDDYVNHQDKCLSPQQRHWFQIAYSDFKRGWGLQSDVWSWGITVLSLLLRLQPEEDRESSKSVCAFDFSFDDLTNMLQPRHRLLQSERSLPRFHEWARRFPLTIVQYFEKPYVPPPSALGLSPKAVEMLQRSLTHQDSRPTAQTVAKILQEAQSVLSTDRRKANKHLSSPHLLGQTLSAPSSESLVSHVNSLQNIEMSRSNSGVASSQNSFGTRTSVNDCSALRIFDMPSPLARSSSLATSEEDSASMGPVSPRRANDVDMSDGQAEGVKAKSPLDTEKTPQIGFSVSSSACEHSPQQADAAVKTPKPPTCPVIIVQDHEADKQGSQEEVGSKVPLRRRLTVSMMSTLRNMIPRNHQHRRSGDAGSRAGEQAHSSVLGASPHFVPSHPEGVESSATSAQPHTVAATDERPSSTASGAPAARPPFLRKSSRQSSKSVLIETRVEELCSEGMVPPRQASAQTSVSQGSTSVTPSKPRTRTSLSAVSSILRARARGNSVSNVVPSNSHSGAPGVSSKEALMNQQQNAMSRDEDGDAMMADASPVVTFATSPLDGDKQKQTARLRNQQSLMSIDQSQPLSSSTSGGPSGVEVSAREVAAALVQVGAHHGPRKRSSTVTTSERVEPVT